MGTVTARARQTPRFDSPEQEVYLTLWRVYDRLRAVEAEVLDRWQLSAQQYNVLRLLQAAHPQPQPTLKVAARLISRAPDITRMVNKLAARGLIRRQRSTADRRTSLLALTPAGLDLLEAIAEPLRAGHVRQLGHLAPAEMRTLTRLLRKAGRPHEPLGSPWR
jgi:DNA-binding MarR family transcriptional regulator